MNPMTSLLLSSGGDKGAGAAVEIVSNTDAAIFIIELVAIAVYVVWSLKTRRSHLLNRLYLLIAMLFAVWVSAVLGMKYTDPDNLDMLFVLDCVTSVAYFIPALSLCIAIVFVRGADHIPKWCNLILVVPVLNVIVCWTNPLHHLQYEVFSIIRSEIVFGPYVYVTGVYSYLAMLSGIIIMLRFAIKNRSRLYLMQSLMFALGFFAPFAISLYATFGGQEVPISLTPLSFSFTIIFNGIAIYQLHLLDIQPVATQRILNWISDGYLILSEAGLVVDYNKPFAEVFASHFGISGNKYLRDCIREQDVSNKTAIFNMISALDACRESMSVVSYEQNVREEHEDGTREYYYVADVTPLVVGEKSAGFVFIFKDVTQLKKSMKQLQESQSHLLEQEHFAFLGQMIAGLAHNLKTPIMGVSGCISAADDLVDECLSSLDDPDVTPDDFREIYGEMRDWFTKVRESTAYMSDIITAIKGQATTVNNFGDDTFTVDELIKRTTLLMRHEFASSGCVLEVVMDEDLGGQQVQGDVNNLTQVLNNLLSNAIYAQKNNAEGGYISLEFATQEERLHIRIRDRGPGIAPDVREHLFKKMITSKGAEGSGLGLYISNTVVRGKFNGSIGIEDNPGGGAVFIIEIPIEIRSPVPVAGSAIGGGFE